MEIYLFFTVILFSATLRLLPHLITTEGIGVDHWFWKAYIEAYRKTGQFPPVLTQFLLEQHQWYPPLFPLLIAKLPNELFERYSHFLAAFIDLLRLALLMSAAFIITGRVHSMVVAGLAYSLSPILISYNSQLNPRGLGALFLDIIVLTLIWLIWHEGPFWAWGMVAFFSGLVLLTHKMTTQLFWFVSLISGVVFLDWRLLMLAPLSFLSALILSRGFYLKILRHHLDIVKFWNKNWKWLSAHQILESPIYGNPGYETPNKYFRGDISGLMHRIKFILGFNPLGWTIFVASLWAYGPYTNLTAEDLWMIQWLGFILLFIALTTFMPFMRCLGNGYLYNYNATFPACLLTAMIWGGLKHDQVVNVILSITLLACLLGIVFYLGTLKHSKTAKIDTEMNFVIKHLQKSPEGVVMCFPSHWHDLVAYKTKNKVLSGGHGYSFKLLEPIWPRLLRPISEIIEEYKVQYLLTYDGYFPENFIKELPKYSLTKFGNYRLYTLNNNLDEK
jgi:hypothetical protein